MDVRTLQLLIKPSKPSENNNRNIWLACLIWDFSKHIIIIFNETKSFLLITNLTHFFQCIYLLPFSVGDYLVCRSGPAYQAVTYTEWHIPDDVLIQFDSPDDEHWVARNMQRREINKYIEKSASSWLLTRIIPWCKSTRDKISFSIQFLVRGIRNICPI